MVQGGMVELETGLVEADLKGNLLRYVYVDGEMVNKALITNGHATVADFPSSFEFKREFVLAQENAMANRRGVWESSHAEGEHQLSPQGTATPAAIFLEVHCPLRRPAAPPSIATTPALWSR